ncbi:MAG: transglutaminase family protein [Candidatus Hydrogenedentes bacterium]|nr:transglutaminase family protein [Candidatus Hydrogenedentota bacterium]
MFIEGVHTITYRFSRPVTLDPYVLRIRPRCNGTQHLAHFALHIEPEPARLSHGIDLEGNAASQVIFENATDRLVFVTEFTVQTLRTDPYDFVITDAGALAVPMRYREDLFDSLAAYRKRVASSDPVERFARGIASECSFNTMTFLTRLNDRLWSMCDKEIRPEGDPFMPEKTLTERRGCCRDLAVLFMDACRAVGIAARYVSGYHWEGDPGRFRRYLHAWAEVYIPGGGWRGYDPSRGLAVADAHIPLAAASSPRDAVPIKGAYRGIDISVEVSTQIDLSLSQGVGASAE